MTEGDLAEMSKSSDQCDDILEPTIQVPIADYTRSVHLSTYDDVKYGE